MAQTAAAPAVKRGADRRQCRDAQHIPEARQSRPLTRTSGALDRQGFYKAFSARRHRSRELVRHDGLGQVVTLRLAGVAAARGQPHHGEFRLGSYRTEFYPTYDYKAIGIGLHERRLAQ